MAWLQLRVSSANPEFADEILLANGASAVSDWRAVGGGEARGLGEERGEVLQLMDDLRSADVDFITIGQYLQPTKKHHEVTHFVTPDEFKGYETIAYAKGFLMVAATPLTRSSHHAGDDFARLRAARMEKLGRG